MDSNHINVNFPNEILNGKKIEGIIVNPVNNQIGVAALSGKMKNMHLLRLYQILIMKDGNYGATHEIGAFTFYTKQELKDFIKSLPEMSAIEILLLMNPHPSVSK